MSSGRARRRKSIEQFTALTPGADGVFSGPGPTIASPKSRTASVGSLSSFHSRKGSSGATRRNSLRKRTASLSPSTLAPRASRESRGFSLSLMIRGRDTLRHAERSPGRSRSRSSSGEEDDDDQASDDDGQEVVDDDDEEESDDPVEDAADALADAADAAEAAAQAAEAALAETAAAVVSDGEDEDSEVAATRCQVPAPGAWCLVPGTKLNWADCLSHALYHGAGWGQSSRFYQLPCLRQARIQCYVLDVAR